MSGPRSDGEAPARRLLVRALLGAVAGLAVAALAIGYLRISRAAFLDEIRSAHPGPLLFAVGGGFVLLGLQSLRWWTVMRPVLPGLRYGHAYRAMLVGFFFNVLLPMRGGDLLRVQYLGRRTGVSRAKLLGTEVVDFFSDKWGWIASFPVVCLLSELLPPHEGPPRWLLRALFGFACLVVAVALLLALMGSRLWRVDALGRPRGPRWLTNLRDGFAAARWRRLLVVETLLAPLPWLWETTVIAVASRSLDLGLTPMQAFAALTAWNMGTFIPSPGNAGSFEATGTLALGALGVAPEKALAFIFLYHLTQVVPGMMAAAALLVAEGEKLFGSRSVFRTVSEPTPAHLSS
ncbi:MAG TPA: lysylphosphatidylglycerol synthase transmembrane domain-containing protein [Myxococcaceae bacterium]|nr:lysylphosphatidylglycerol synthase transmembrane domain-containing protein [Myxococcaceae bacterium]